MSIIAYYQYLGKGKIKSVDINAIKRLTNPGAICTVQRHTVISPFNKSFTLEETKEIIEFLIKEIKKHERKINNI